MSNAVAVGGPGGRELVRGSFRYNAYMFWRKYGAGYMLLMPFAVLFVLFIILPVFVAGGLSFTSYNMLEKPVWLGITNFRGLFLEDDVFLIALRNTLIFAVVTGPLGYMMSFIAAWVINELRFRNAFALAFYAPSITSAIFMSVIWLYFFSSDRYGLINNWLIKINRT